MSPPPLPSAVDEINARWLSSALGRTVHTVEVLDPIWGSATKLCLRVHYADAPGPGDPPEALCVKGGFNPVLLQQVSDAGAVSPYAAEARFFAELGPTLDAPLPRCWYAAADDSTGQGIIVLDDLNALGCTFGEPTEPWDVDRVAVALDVQARWHAHTWGRPAIAPWLGVGSPVRLVAAGLLSDPFWQMYFASDTAPVLPPELADPGRLRRGFGALWKHDDRGPLCLVHGDAHLGNTYIEAGGSPAFLDWQGVGLGPWSYDVAYFVSGALTVPDRRIHEQELLAHYVDALVQHGGPRIPAAEAWDGYRRHLLHGFLWALTPPILQPLERVAAMTERHLAAIADHDPLALLGC